jgi:xylulokinase
MEAMGIKPSIIRAGNANMFLSSIFRETLSTLTQTPIELYDTDGAKGAALAAGIGIGFYKSRQEAFSGLKKILTVEPEIKEYSRFLKVYNTWEEVLKNTLNTDL